MDALEGQPGVYSARFAGNQKSDAANNAKLLAELGELPSDRRSAHFHCCLVMAAPNHESLVVEGICDGEIAKFPSGEGGFGYDPLFFVPEIQKTFGQLSREEKNQISHRAKAVNLLMEQWEEWLESVNH